MMSNIAPSHPLDKARGTGEEAEARKRQREIDQICHGTLPQLLWRGDRAGSRQGDMWKAGAGRKNGVKRGGGGVIPACRDMGQGAQGRWY